MLTMNIIPIRIQCVPINSIKTTILLNFFSVERLNKLLTIRYLLGMF